MRMGGLLVLVLVAGTVAAAWLLPPGVGFAAPRDAAPQAATGARRTTVAPARGELAMSGRDEPASARVGEAAPVAVPPSLHEFCARDRAGESVAAAYARADLERLFVEAPKGADTEPGAAHAFVDLDGDGRDEAFAVIGDGWWGRRIDALVFTAQGATWSIADRWTLEGAARGTPGLITAAAGTRRWVVLTSGDGWGTGYSHAKQRWFEFANGRLTEVLAITSSSEQIYGGYGPSIDWGIGPLAMTDDTDGVATLATATANIGFWAGEFGTGLSDPDTTFTMRWRQPRRGARFEPVEPADGLADENQVWRIGARAWLAKNAGVRRRGRGTERVSASHL